MAKVIAILDNGPGKRGSACDDCGTMLRYEYHTDDGGRYGSRCIHAHIHDQDWLTFQAAQDAKKLKMIQRHLARIAEWHTLECTIYRDGSATIRGISRYGEDSAETIEELKALGWRIEKSIGRGDLPGSKVYHLTKGD